MTKKSKAAEPDWHLSVSWRERLSTKFALLWASTGALFGVVILVSAGWLVGYHVETTEESTAEQIAHTLAVALSVSADAEGRLEARQLRALAEAVPRLEAAWVIGRDGQELGRWDDGSGRSRPSSTHRSAPILSQEGGANVGTIHVSLARGNIGSQLDHLWQLIGVLIVGSIALSFVAGRTFGNRLAAPIQETAKSAQAIADGQVDATQVTVPSRDEIGVLARSLNELKSVLRDLSDKATRVAGGDLAVQIDGTSALNSGFKKMLENLRDLVRGISASVVQLNSASEEILATSKRQEEGAMAQSSAVEETRRTLEALLNSGKRIAEASESVLSAAERAHQNNQLIGKRIGHLTSRTEAIGEVLETIKSIASKSDLLALNAALEGTKAGEAGRGFSLVATQMQRLTENVVDAVKDIKGITQHIQEATNATVLATEEGIKQAADVTQAARQISLIIRQQQSGIEQTTQSVNDISDVAQNAAAGASQTTAAVEDLVSLSRKLQVQLETFRLGAEHHD